VWILIIVADRRSGDLVLGQFSTIAESTPAVGRIDRFSSYARGLITGAGGNGADATSVNLR
jgi:hypothetical protein